MKDTQELETQRKIYVLITKQPGLHLSKIAEILDISIPLADYHLRSLEKNDLVISEKIEGYLRFFIKEDIGIKDKKYFSLFRHEMLLKIVLFLLKHPYSRHKTILENIPMTRSLLTYYLNKLVKKEIIAIQEFKNEKGYVVLNHKEIVRFLIKYEPYKLVKGIDETWTDFNIG
jgi:predicted transcriptional regulator